MTIDIIVLRGLGDRPGDDIEDRLITEVGVALERGRNEFDEKSGLQSIALTCVLRPTLAPGLLVEVHDSLQGEVWRGKITSVRHVVAGDEAITELEIVRPQ